MSLTNEVYFPIAQLWSLGALDLIVRSNLPTPSLTASVGAAIRRVDPQIPIDDSWTLDALVDASVSPRCFTLQLLGAFTASMLVGTRMLGSLLYGVEPTDPVTFVSMIAVLLAVAFVSGLIPAIRASRTDSASALRSAT